MISVQTGRRVLQVAAVSACSFLAVTAALGVPQHAGKKKPPVTKKEDPKVVAAGKKIYAAQKCDACHAINGKGGTSGPELTKTGADTRHTAAWFEEQIKNPKAHKPDGTMPAYDDKVKGKDLKALVAYMGSLKK